MLIALSGEKPVESWPRRHVSQSPSGTRASIASVTGVILSSGLTRAGSGGNSTPAESPPPGLGMPDGNSIARSAAGSPGSALSPGS